MADITTSYDASANGSAVASGRTPLDVEPAFEGPLLPDLEQLGHQIGGGHPRAGRCRRQAGRAGAGGHVEHPVPRAEPAPLHEPVALREEQVDRVVGDCHLDRHRVLHLPHQVRRREQDCQSDDGQALAPAFRHLLAEQVERDADHREDQRRLDHLFASGAACAALSHTLRMPARRPFARSAVRTTSRAARPTTSQSRLQ